MCPAFDTDFALHNWTFCQDKSLKEKGCQGGDKQKKKAESNDDRGSGGGAVRRWPIAMIVA